MTNGEDKKRSRSWIPLALILVFLLVFWSISEEYIPENISLCKAADKSYYKTAALTKPEVSDEAVSLQDSFANVTEHVKPAVVNISTLQVLKIEQPLYEFYFGDPFENFFDEFFGRPRSEERNQQRPQQRYYERKREGTGTGVIIDPKGYVLTNYHVIAGAEDIKVKLSGKEDKEYDAKVIGADSRTDLAVVKIKGSKKFPTATLGDSDAIRVGDWVLAIGSPFGLEQTVTVGIISAKRQSVPIEGKVYRDLIQTDAAINRGNSGGPLVNIRGEVIGINTAIYAPTGVFSGVGFAIPINNAKAITDELIEKGKVVRGWLGVEIKEVDEIVAKQFGLKEDRGALVNRVFENSAAQKGGMKRGDVIIEFDGKKIEDVRNLQEIVGDTKPGKKVDVTLIRDNKEKKIKIELGEMPETVEKVPFEEEEAEEDVKWMGIEVRNLTNDMKKQYGIPEDAEGVVIFGIDPLGELSRAGLAEGDLIRSINRKDIKSMNDFKEITKDVKLSKGVMFDILRSGRPLYITFMTQE